MPPLRWLGLVWGLLLLSSCAGVGALWSPPMTVTPATAPIAIAGVTPTTPAAAAITATPVPERTPIRVKVPAAPAVAATASVERWLTPIATGLAPEPLPTLAPDENRLERTMNILIAGSDERREGGPWRADVVMVVAVDLAAREVGVISFPRDLWVRIPTVGENRINTATFFGELYRYPTGGIGLLADTIHRNFGIRLDHYVKINFEGFKQVVDALGGVDITVDCPLTGWFPPAPGSNDLVWMTLQPGEYHMDGVLALQYVRERKTTSDVDRARRQQRMILALRKRARDINILPRVPVLFDALRDTIETDLGLTEIVPLARLALQIEPKDAHGFIIDFQHTQSWTTPDGARVLLPKMKRIQEGIRDLFAQPSILENPFRPANCRNITPEPSVEP
jgi:LCP family protein required for cell wall assembly